MQAKGLSKIRFLGYVTDEDLVCLYKSCEFCIATARWGEGFGIPVVEAYLFGKVIVAPNLCAFPEIIFSLDHLYENNIESLSSAIDRARKFQDHEKLAQYYSQRFSNEAIREKYLSLYSELYL